MPAKGGITRVSTKRDIIGKAGRREKATGRIYEDILPTYVSRKGAASLASQACLEEKVSFTVWANGVPLAVYFRALKIEGHCGNKMSEEKEERLSFYKKRGELAKAAGQFLVVLLLLLAYLVVCH